MKRIFAAARRLLFPTLCVVCSQVTDGDVLCTECLEKYASESRRKCLRCRLSAEECSCASDCGVSGILFGTFYTHYSRRDGRVTETLLYILKTQKCDALCEFFARESSARLMRHILKSGRRGADYTLTYVPRSREALKRYGFDHAEEVAKRISRLTGIPLERYLKRSGGSEQKKLSSKSRLDNARRSLNGERGVCPAGKRVILFDDIVTTGASLSRGREILLEEGALEVVPVVIARTLFY